MPWMPLLLRVLLCLALVLQGAGEAWARAAGPMQRAAAQALPAAALDAACPGHGDQSPPDPGERSAAAVCDDGQGAPCCPSSACACACSHGSAMALAALPPMFAARGGGVNAIAVAWPWPAPDLPHLTRPPIA